MEINITEYFLEKQYKRVIEQFLVGDCTRKSLRSRMIKYGCTSLNSIKKGLGTLWIISTSDKKFYYQVDKYNKISFIGVRSNVMVTSKR